MASKDVSREKTRKNQVDYNEKDGMSDSQRCFVW
jgi:hypothetical protein